MSKTNILFIINPISGGKRKVKIPDLITAHLDGTQFQPTCIFTDYAGHAAELATAATDFGMVVAVGGDGTVNEVASALVGTHKPLGIIPLGSGNGLARFLKIPMNTKRAIQLLNHHRQLRMDAAKMNGRYFFNMAGMGFDAHISLIFAHNKSRGLKGYVEMGLKEIISYKPQTYHIEIDGEKLDRTALAISIANSAQYGNNVYISPKSSIDDGLLDVCIVKNFPKYKLPILAYQMIRSLTDRSDLVEIIQGRSIQIKREKKDAVHLDGEPFMMGNNIDVTILPLSLTVIVRP
ncbi:MAG: diacylglycerol kinase family lipid kinase [Pedobacter sp.]|nr:diacylglycerol kinase family lipid kinase [Pedobacter sp.]MDQ8052794.1 diacylglycerol kinase family lipid kinase [Pedobacter sp.]